MTAASTGQTGRQEVTTPSTRLHAPEAACHPRRRCHPPHRERGGPLCTSRWHGERVTGQKSAASLAFPTRKNRSALFTVVGTDISFSVGSETLSHQKIKCFLYIFFLVMNTNGFQSCVLLCKFMLLLEGINKLKDITLGKLLKYSKRGIIDLI